MKALLIITLMSSAALLGSAEETKKEKGQLPAYYGCGNAETIDRTLFTPEENSVHFIFDQKISPDTSEIRHMDWFRLHDDNYFTAYLVNTTDTTFHAKRQDGSLIMIQEAKDENGEWKPIEFWIPSGCGNSYFNPLELAPNEFAKVAIVKYSGRFQTELRLKFKYSSEIMYSQPFSGSINPAQLEEEKDNVNGILYYGKAKYLD